MRRLWLIFAQTTTVCLAILFIVATLRPEWLPRRGGPGANNAIVVPFFEATPGRAGEGRAVASYAAATQKAAPAVVNIFTSKETPQLPTYPFSDDPVFRHFFGEPDLNPEPVSSLGSGVIVSPEGYILTNNHVIEAADEIEVALADGRKGKASLVGSDPETDLAVLKLDMPNLPAVTFGRAEDLQVGDVVLAIGNPFGVGQTTTMGIVSALGRTHLGINTFENFIQTDAAINPGNSGGPLLDSAGRLIGINTAIYSPSGASAGIGFAVPVDTVMRVVPQLIKTGKYIRPALGIEVDEQLNRRLQALTGTQGVFVLRVAPGSAAQKAGLSGITVGPEGIVPGDRITGIDGAPVDDVAKLLARLDDRKVGDVVVLSVERAGKPREVRVELQPGA